MSSLFNLLHCRMSKCGLASVSSATRRSPRRNNLPTSPLPKKLRETQRPQAVLALSKTSVIQHRHWRRCKRIERITSQVAMATVPVLISNTTTECRRSLQRHNSSHHSAPPPPTTIHPISGIRPPIRPILTGETTTTARLAFCFVMNRGVPTAKGTCSGDPAFGPIICIAF